MEGLVYLCQCLQYQVHKLVYTYTRIWSENKTEVISIVLYTTFSIICYLHHIFKVYYTLILFFQFFFFFLPFVKKKKRMLALTTRDMCGPLTRKLNVLNAFPLNRQNRWRWDGKALPKRWVPVGYQLEGLRKAF